MTNQAQISSTIVPPGSAPAHPAAGKYLIFNLADEDFGIQILKVREIIGLQDITFVPNTPACVKGVINLRGKVIPVIDLRLKFGMTAAEYNDRTCIVVVGVQTSGNPVLMGVVVDSVSEVLSIAATDIEEAPDFGEQAEANYIVGMAKVKNRVKILLDIDQVMSGHGVLASLPGAQAKS